MTDIYETDYKAVATWLRKPDFEKLKNIANTNNVTISAFLRAVIIDVLFEEEELSNAPVAAPSSHVIQNGSGRQNTLDPL